MLPRGRSPSRPALTATHCLSRRTMTCGIACSRRWGSSPTTAPSQPASAAHPFDGHRMGRLNPRRSALFMVTARFIVKRMRVVRSRERARRVPNLGALAHTLLMQAGGPLCHGLPQLCAIGAPGIPHLRQLGASPVQDARILLHTDPRAPPRCPQVPTPSTCTPDRAAPRYSSPRVYLHQSTGPHLVYDVIDGGDQLGEAAVRGGQKWTQRRPALHSLGKTQRCLRTTTRHLCSSCDVVS